MAKIIRIYSSLEEIDDIFDQGIVALDHALELFSMIKHDDSGSKFMANKIQQLIKDANQIKNGIVPND